MSPLNQVKMALHDLARCKRYLMNAHSEGLEQSRPDLHAKLDASIYAVECAVERTKAAIELWEDE